VYLGSPVTISGTYRYALSRLPSILWITVLTTLATLLGLVLLIIPGIIALVRLAFAPVALVVEGHRGPGALRRSWRLTKGFFWRTLGTIVLSGLIVAIVSGIASIPGEIAVQALGPDAWPISALVNMLATVLVTPFGMVVIVLLYFDLRIRKEGFDIEVMARELATAP
jgi:membrane-anchored glycerophosphoryl diester phosphodiesterase (GDPDase)